MNQSFKVTTLSYKDLRAMFSGAIEVIKAYRSIPLDTLNLKLNPETWSCTEVCQHLILFNRLYIRQMERAIEAYHPLPMNGKEIQPGWIACRLIRFMEPPYTFRIKTIAPLFPSKSETTTIDETIDTLIDTENQLLGILRKAEHEQWDLNRIKGKNPALKFVKMSLTEFFLLTDAHQRRHFWQIEQLLKRLPID